MSKQTPMWPGDIKHPILKNWLIGTTCYNYYVGRSVLFENEHYIVLKHNSHASYAGRFADTRACKAYAALYRKADLELDAKGHNANLFNGYGDLKRWEGRISKTKVCDECKDLGILFASPETHQ